MNTPHTKFTPHTHASTSSDNLRNTKPIISNTCNSVDSIIAPNPEQQLIALQKEFDAYKEFTRHIVHDMSTPLLCVLGFLKVAGTAIKKWDFIRAADHIYRAIRSGDRLHWIVQNVLVDSKYDKNWVKLELTLGKLGLTVTNILAEIEYLAREKGISITIVDTVIGNISYDEQKMARVFLNLIGNAIKFCSPGDGIEISLSNTEWSIFVSVSDTGQWIPSGEIDSLFQNYSQLERSRKSEQWVGLGLSICKSIIEAHGGKIWATNNDTKGANFRIRLPRIPAIEENKLH